MNFEDYESLPTQNVATHMTAGAIAGIMEHCVMYPLDSVKTRMQSLATPARVSISETFLKMIRTEGILRPVRGMSAMVVGAGPSHALYFSSYEYLKNAMIQHSSTERYHTAIYGASGCMSTLLHDGIMNPAEVVKQRMQMLNSPFKSAIQCFLDIYRKEGMPAFYRSYTTQLTMNIPFQSIHFMVYELSQNLINKERQYNPPAHMASGALAGGLAAAITTPLDVCKTLLNTQQGVRTNGMIEAVKKVYQLGGPMGYFRGVQARVMYQMPATMICWTTYEFFKYLLIKTPDVRLVKPILAEPEANLGQVPEEDDQKDTPPPPVNEKFNLKPRELPVMSGAGLYGSISFNTMHHANSRSNSSNNRTDSFIDIVHT